MSIISGERLFEQAEGSKMRVRFKVEVPPRAFELGVFKENVDVRAVDRGKIYSDLLTPNMPTVSGIHFGIHEAKVPGQALKTHYKAPASPCLYQCARCLCC